MFLVVVPFRLYPPYIKVKIIMYLSSIRSTSPDESRYVTLSWKLIFCWKIIRCIVRAASSKFAQ